MFQTKLPINSNKKVCLIIRKAERNSDELIKFWSCKCSINLNLLLLFIIRRSCTAVNLSHTLSSDAIFTAMSLLWKQINQTDGPSLLSEIQVQSRLDSAWGTPFWWHTAVLPIQSSREPNYPSISSHPGYKWMTSRQSHAEMKYIPAACLPVSEKIKVFHQTFFKWETNFCLWAF